ncbi:hypothetical protein OPQ81_011136 [Rhizoctonia solani]|nr:hypothetical protein OPQ81_011136 [Rhizoctonia solani]
MWILCLNIGQVRDEKSSLEACPTDVERSLIILRLMRDIEGEKVPSIAFRMDHFSMLPVNGILESNKGNKRQLSTAQTFKFNVSTAGIHGTSLPTNPLSTQQLWEKLFDFSALVTYPGRCSYLYGLVVLEGIQSSGNAMHGTFNDIGISVCRKQT